MTTRRSRRLSGVVGLWCLVQLVAAIAQTPADLRAAAQRETNILDGAASVDPAALADLAVERALLGGHWLARVVRADGSFYYVYDPVSDAYQTQAYNEVRHAGTTYAMYQAYGVTRDGAVLMGAERATGYIDANSLILPGAAGRGYVDPKDGIVKLGGQALALVALLERRRVTGDDFYDGLITDLAAFLLWMEIPDDPGRYYQSFDTAWGARLLEPPSDFYPGECLLALTRMAQQFPEGPYLAAASRAADYLIHRKDGDIPELGTAPRDDHWLTIALAELYRLDPVEEYATVVLIQANRMLNGQIGPDESAPLLIGGARQSGGVVRFGSTATKGEALAAAWSLFAFAGDTETAAAIAKGSLRNAQFVMRVQYTEQNTANLPSPRRAIGGWAGGTDDPTIRIDTVQHSISALLGFSEMARSA